MVTTATPPPLILFGLEAADFHLIQRWAEGGYLPNIAALMEGGCWGKLGGPEMVSEHGVWVSLYSGLSRPQHGYYYWRPLKPGTYDLQLADFIALGTLPFWAGLRERPKKVAIIDPPEGYPLEGLSGVQLANWAPHNARYATCSLPLDLLDELRGRFGPPMYVEEMVRSTPRADSSIHRGLLKQIEQKGAICRHLIGADRYDLVVTTFFESHVAGHQFLKYSSEDGTPGTGLSNALRDVYQAIDEQLGRLIAVVPDANVFAISNVGLHEEYPSRDLLEAFCLELGYQVASRSRPARFDALTWVRDKMPRSWRFALRDRLPKRMLHRVKVGEYRAGTDWSRTTVFPVPSLYTGFLRVNLRGREPEGIVDQGREYAELLDRVEEDLGLLVDPRSKLPAVKKVTRTVDHFGGDPPLWLPDLFVVWAPTTYLVEKVVHPNAVLLQENLDFARGSHHTHHGFVAAAGPGIRRGGCLGNVQVLDLAPTFQALLEEPVLESMTGKAIDTMLAR
ncbi:MAG: alkaline phosphatase family protein [Gemmatimonadota bacterium]